jgi:hypothetical protein
MKPPRRLGTGTGVEVRTADGWQKASCVSDINALVEDEGLRRYYSVQLKARGRARIEFMTDKLGQEPDAIFAECSNAEQEALYAFAELVPTTLQGFTAKLQYLSKIVSDPAFDMSDDYIMLWAIVWSISEYTSLAEA